MVYICALLSGLGTSKSWNMTAIRQTVISAGIISFHMTIVKLYDLRASCLVRKMKLLYSSLNSHFSFKLTLDKFEILNSKQKNKRN